jgi:prepilin-type N-terminal cleavage/methylation domain-containing protein
MTALSGVTLIELIIAMAILTAVGIPLSAMIGAQIQGMMTSTDLTTAGNLARREVARLNNIPYTHTDLDPVSPGTLTTSYSDPVFPFDFTRTVTTVAGAGGAERKDITLSVKRTGTSAILVTIYSSIAKGVSYA